MTAESSEPADPGSSLVVGVDVGGTKVLGVLAEFRPAARSDRAADRAPEVLATERIDVRGPGVGEAIIEVTRRLCASGSASRGGRAPGAVGVGVAGYLGLDGVAVASANVPSVVGEDVGASVSRAVGLPVVVDNDANCVARAAVALRFPAVSDLVAVTLGTGIGGGVVIDGALVRGARGFAGEPGHMVVDPSGPACPCGRRGCWERYASGAGLAMLASRAVVAGTAPELAGRSSIRGEHVVAAARQGLPGALAVMDEFGGWVALGISNIANLLDPEVVVIGGGLADELDTFLPAVHRSLELDPTMVGRRMAVERVPGGSHAGALGAALAAHGSPLSD